MNDKRPHRADSTNMASDAAAKRAYLPPQLQSFGKLQQLTQSGTGIDMEGASGKGMPIMA